MALDALDAIFAKVPEGKKKRSKTNTKPSLSSKPPKHITPKQRQTKTKSASSNAPERSVNNNDLDDIFAEVLSTKAAKSKGNNSLKSDNGMESPHTKSKAEAQILIRPRQSKGPTKIKSVDPAGNLSSLDPTDDKRPVKRLRMISSLDMLFRSLIKPKSRAAMLLGSLESRSILLDNPQKEFSLASTRAKARDRRNIDNSKQGNGLDRATIRLLLSELKKPGNAPHLIELRTLNENWVSYAREQLETIGGDKVLSGRPIDATEERAIATKMKSLDCTGAIIAAADYSFSPHSAKLETLFQKSLGVVLYETKNAFIVALVPKDKWQTEDEESITVATIPMKGALFHLLVKDSETLVPFMK